MHSPDHAGEVAESGRLGGLRRRRERALAGAYEFDGLASIEQIRRLLEIAVFDTLSLDSSIARSRILGHLAGAAGRLLEIDELQEEAGLLGDYNEDMQKIRTIRMNLMAGHVNSMRFIVLFNEMVAKYGREELYGLLAVNNERQFKELYYNVRAQLPTSKIN